MTARASNTNPIQSAAAQAGQVGQDATHASAWDSANGGNWLWKGAIDNDLNPDPLGLNDRYELPAGRIRFEYEAGEGESASMELRAVRGKIRNGVYVQYHRGDPGANATANVIAIARTFIAEANFTVETV